jgi:hypothetical protein
MEGMRMTQLDDGVVQQGPILELRSRSFVYRLDRSAALTAVAWENRLSGRKVSLGGGPELEVDVDAAQARIPITGWKTDGSPGRWEAEKADFAMPEFRDASWQGQRTPMGAAWARTHVFLPPQAQGQAITLVLGRFGILDYRHMDVFLNGQLVGTRKAEGLWTEPGRFVLERGSPHYALWRWGTDNVIALRLGERMERNARLDAMDPEHAWSLADAAWARPLQFEQYVTVGAPWRTLGFQVKTVLAAGEPPEALEAPEPPEALEARCELESDDGSLTATIRYGWRADQTTLHKFVEIRNAGPKPIRLLHVRLGQYRTDTVVSDGEQGFPVYVGDDRFVSLAHPSGWAIGRGGGVCLRQYPGKTLGSGAGLRCMEMVLGVGTAGRGRAAFLEHIRGRMRRTVRGHDGPYAIFEPFGARTDSKVDKSEALMDESEAFLLDNIRKVAEAQRQTGLRWDFYSIDFWLDARGDLMRCDPQDFPRGLDPIRRELEKLGTAPGLWVDSSSLTKRPDAERWNHNGNPVVAPAWDYDPAYGPDVTGAMCRATEPARSMYTTAFRHHIRANGVRMLKFDNLLAVCYNPHHDHLPGIYSTEAIQSSVIEFFQALDAESHDVFLMLYWGYRSPWWLLYADTLWEPGLAMEAASPGGRPALYARDGVTIGLDQAQVWCEDIPLLGKESLGVWLSDWWWNSCVGSERWPEGFVMDLCRGSLLAQPWSNASWLDEPQRRQMAELVALLRQRPGCFGNPRLILGDPWKYELYGYSCSDGKRAFVAINNCTWQDAIVPLRPGPAWGLPAGQQWDWYRWYPQPARLRPGQGPMTDGAELTLRPFEVVLLELVPAGDKPSGDRRFTDQLLSGRWAQASRVLVVTVTAAADDAAPALGCEKEHKPEELPPRRVLRVRGELPACPGGGTLAVSVALRHKGKALMRGDGGKYFAAAFSMDGQPVAAVPAVGQRTFPACWQTWRLVLPASSVSRVYEALVAVRAPADAEASCTSHWVPTDEAP